MLFFSLYVVLRDQICPIFSELRHLTSNKFVICNVLSFQFLYMSLYDFEV